MLQRISKKYLKRTYNMKEFASKRIFDGYALGKLVVYQDVKKEINNEFEGEEKEFNRFKEARSKAILSFEKLYQDTLMTLGENEAQLFLTHKLMAEDLDFEDQVKENITSSLNAEKATLKASETLSSMFEEMDDSYMKERAKDVLEVGKKIVDILTQKEEFNLLKEPSILICDDLPSSELMKLDKNLLIGLVLVKGSINSHVSILTRMLEIPSICAIDELKVDESLNNKFAIIDGLKGKLIIDPTSKDITKYSKIKDEYLKDLEELSLLRGKMTKTQDNKELKIYSNIASSVEVENVIKNDAEGVGLFRSEFIYLDSKTYPTEEEQFIHYKKVVETMKDKEVIIRTLDIGADKKIDYFDLPEEENPALGYRSIRICKDRPAMFLDQLTALYRASAYGNLSIMIPMIISLSEVEFVKEMCGIAKNNLASRGEKFNPNMKIGIMIETPAAAIMSDVLAQHVDFFSIGTNDLSQYTLAIDRVNPLLDKTFNPHHKAILRLIKLTVENGHKANIPVGICGELARDEELVPFFCALGVDELSVSPSYVLKLRKQISTIDTSKVDINKFVNSSK